MEVNLFTQACINGNLNDMIIYSQHHTTCDIGDLISHAISKNNLNVLIYLEVLFPTFDIKNCHPSFISRIIDIEHINILNYFYFRSIEDIKYDDFISPVGKVWDCDVEDMKPYIGMFMLRTANTNNIDILVNLRTVSKVKFIISIEEYETALDIALNLKHKFAVDELRLWIPHDLLPVYNFTDIIVQQTVNSITRYEDEICSMCSKHLIDMDKNGVKHNCILCVLSCGHIFHKQCIVRFLKYLTVTKCPYCLSIIKEINSQIITFTIEIGTSSIVVNKIFDLSRELKSILPQYRSSYMLQYANIYNLYPKFELTSKQASNIANGIAINNSGIIYINSAITQFLQHNCFIEFNMQHTDIDLTSVIFKCIQYDENSKVSISPEQLTCYIFLTNII